MGRYCPSSSERSLSPLGDDLVADRGLSVRSGGARPYTAPRRRAARHHASRIRLMDSAMLGELFLQLRLTFFEVAQPRSSRPTRRLLGTGSSGVTHTDDRVPIRVRTRIHDTRVRAGANNKSSPSPPDVLAWSTPKGAARKRRGTGPMARRSRILLHVPIQRVVVVHLPTWCHEREQAIRRVALSRPRDDRNHVGHPLRDPRPGRLHHLTHICA
jgi:hypothetical protein